MLLTQAALQATHRRTPAPCGMLAVPAALPTEGVHCAACPAAVIHLINLEWAMERVWMPSKLACCLSNLCLAAMTLSCQFLLHWVELSGTPDKLKSKWCLSAKDRAQAKKTAGRAADFTCCSTHLSWKFLRKIAFWSAFTHLTDLEPKVNFKQN